jgi:hypothetical protein
MKRGATYIFTLFYLLVSTGLTLDVHYCGGKMVDVEVFGTPDHCCSKVQPSCQKEEENKCCSNESVLVQLDQWQVISSTPSLDLAYLTVPRHFHNFDLLENIGDNELQIFNDLPPPIDQPRWLLYRSLLFYG